MNTYKVPGTRKWIAAALAFGVTFGGVWIAPEFGSTTYAAAIQQVPFASSWNSAERTALVKSLAMSDKAAEDFYSDPDNARYQAVKIASGQARALLLDPTTSPSKLNTARNALDSALAAYIAEYITDSSVLERQTFQTARMLNDLIYMNSEIYPQEAIVEMMTVIDQAQAVAYDGNSTVEQFRESYLKYIEASAALQDSAHTDRSARLVLLEQQRQTIEALSANLSGNEDYAKLLATFRTHADGLESLLNGTSSLLAIQESTLCVQIAYDWLTEGIQLAGELEQARGLLDSPKGIRSGQRPSSAFGELRKSINISALVLSRASTKTELGASRASLADAVMKFNSTLRY